METWIHIFLSSFPSACLNRTMQYGNHFNTFLVADGLFQFKSYYVVWKPTDVVTFGIASTCLNRTMQYGNHVQSELLQPMLLFKSYYVVWKQKRTQTVLKKDTGLNRTMQYGNFHLCNAPNFRIPGLNRTMQYGNFFFWLPNMVSALVV